MAGVLARTRKPSLNCNSSSTRSYPQPWRTAQSFSASSKSSKARSTRSRVATKGTLRALKTRSANKRACIWYAHIGDAAADQRSCHAALSSRHSNETSRKTERRSRPGRRSSVSCSYRSRNRLPPSTRPLVSSSCRRGLASPSGRRSKVEQSPFPLPPEAYCLPCP